MKKNKYAYIFDKTYWLPVLMVTILTYGFALTNYSIGIDDPAMIWYIDEKRLLQQGRWIYEILSVIVNVSEFLPFWLDFISLLLYLITEIIWILVFLDSSGGKISKKSCIFFACLYISFPYIAEIFIFMPATILSAVNMLCAALSVYLYRMFFSVNRIRNKLFLFIGGGGLLAVGFGGYESSLIYYACGVVIVIWLEQIYINKFKICEIIKKITLSIAMGLCAIVISKIILFVLIKYYNTQSYSYASAYFAYGLQENILKQIINTCYALFRDILSDCNIVNVTLVFSIIIIVISSIYWSIRNKDLKILLMGISLLIVNFGIIIGTGNIAIANSTKRILVTYGLFTSFALSYLLTFLNKLSKRIIDVALVLFLCVIIIRQSREMVNIFLVDHQRAVLDTKKASFINYEIEKLDWKNKPIIFVGVSEDYVATMAEDPLQSYFSFFGDRVDEEINTYITMYMNCLGYIYPTALQTGMVQAAVSDAIDQTSYPKEGYVKEYSDYIVVKLGTLGDNKSH